jgi:hypothetical protein
MRKIGGRGSKLKRLKMDLIEIKCSGCGGIGLPPVKPSRSPISGMQN